MAGKFKQVGLVIGGHIVLEESAQLVALLHQAGGSQAYECLRVRHEKLLRVEILLVQMFGHQFHKTLVYRMAEFNPVILQ